MQKLLENSQLDPSGSQTWNSRFPLQEKGNSVDVFFWLKKTLSSRLVEKAPTWSER
jgi:hypothetical protein